MQYNTPIYLCFFLPIVLAAYYFAPKKNRWITLLAASLIFYYISGGILVLFILGTTALIYATGIWLDKINVEYKSKMKGMEKTEKKKVRQEMTRKKKQVVGFSTVILLGVLMFLKYFNFFGSNVNAMLSVFGVGNIIPSLSLLMPLGISFYTMSAISYIVDVYRGVCVADKNYGRLCLFLSFFPQITEGPICRYGQTAKSLYEGNEYKSANVVNGFEMIIWGLFKKMVIADRLNLMVNQIFSNNQNYGGMITIIGMLGYTIQLYADFSGCMDIACGTGRLFGVNMPQNFARPFFSKSASEFWRRWHISLGTWFKDYLFYPFSMSSGIKKLSKFARERFGGRTAKLLPALTALFMVWFSTGLWHGASWKYVVYGLYYFVLIALGMLFEPITDALIKKLNINIKSRWYITWQVLRTFVLVNFGMLIFRADNLVVCKNMFMRIFANFNFGQMLSFFNINLKIDRNDIYVLVISVLFMLVIEIFQEKGIKIREKISAKPTAIRWSLYYVGIIVIIIFGAYGWGYSPAALMYASF